MVLKCGRLAAEACGLAVWSTALVGNQICRGAAPNKQARYFPQLSPLNCWVFAPHKRGEAHLACRAVPMETTEPLTSAAEQTQQELCLGLLPPELLVAVFAHVPLEER